MSQGAFFVLREPCAISPVYEVRGSQILLVAAEWSRFRTIAWMRLRQLPEQFVPAGATLAEACEFATRHYGRVVRLVR